VFNEYVDLKIQRDKSSEKSFTKNSSQSRLSQKELNKIKLSAEKEKIFKF